MKTHRLLTRVTLSSMLGNNPDTYKIEQSIIRTFSCYPSLILPACKTDISRDWASESKFVFYCIHCMYQLCRQCSFCIQPEQAVVKVIRLFCLHFSITLLQALYNTHLLLLHSQRYMFNKLQTWKQENIGIVNDLSILTTSLTSDTGLDTMFIGCTCCVLQRFFVLVFHRFPERFGFIQILEPKGKVGKMY